MKKARCDPFFGRRGVPVFYAFKQEEGDLLRKASLFYREIFRFLCYDIPTEMIRPFYREVMEPYVFRFAKVEETILFFVPFHVGIFADGARILWLGKEGQAAMLKCDIGA